MWRMCAALHGPERPLAITPSCDVACGGSARVCMHAEASLVYGPTAGKVEGAAREAGTPGSLRAVGPTGPPCPE